jgi:cystathionine beta-lyase
VRTFVPPGAKTLIQPPVYYPFFSAIQNNEAEIASSALVLEERQYRMDFNDLAETLRDPKVKMAILCNPHNPVGRVWTRKELLRFGEMCLENNVLIVSDEIYADLIYRGNTFTPFAILDEAFTQQAIICTAPSKTFNLAGLQTSNMIIPNPDLRLRFLKILEKNGLFGIGVFGGVALEAAYRYGEDWLEQVLEYLEGNLHCLENYLDRQIPGIRLIPPEGTYLAWLDCRSLGLDQPELMQLMLKDARVHLEDGTVFGREGDGFLRMNIACPRSMLIEVLERIRGAIERRQLA